MNTKKRFVVFSIETDLTKNVGRRSGVEEQLNKYGFKKVIGSYKGALENSYVVDASEDTALKEVIDLATEFYQESVLVIDETGIATLQFLTSPANATVLGHWTPIESLEAKDLDNWTLDGSNYYTVK